MKLIATVFQINNYDFVLLAPPSLRDHWVIASVAQGWTDRPSESARQQHHHRDSSSCSHGRYTPSLPQSLAGAFLWLVWGY